jgi:hypothetical protein
MNANAADERECRVLVAAAGYSFLIRYDTATFRAWLADFGVTTRS